MRARISFFNNFNLLESHESVNVVGLDFSEINYPFSCKFSSKTLKKQKKRYFQDDFQPLRTYVPINSKTAHPPRAIPGRWTRVKLCTVGNFTQNEARLVGHFDFCVKMSVSSTDVVGSPSAECIKQSNRG